MKEDIKEHEFKKGVSGNPKGRPVGARSIKTVLKELLEGIDSDKDWGNPIAKELVKIAFGGDSSDNDKLKAIQQMLDRMDGKPQQTIENTTDMRVILDNPEEGNI